MNLALFNILPIPALDGARCVFVLIEMIFRKPVPRKIENLINSGLELKDAMDVYFDEHGINEREGAIGYFTNNYLPRMEIFTHITKLLYGQYTYFKKRGVK